MLTLSLLLALSRARPVSRSPPRSLARSLSRPARARSLAQAHALIASFLLKKRPDDDLFEQIKPQDLNEYFHEVMDGLTAKAGRSDQPTRTRRAVRPRTRRVPSALCSQLDAAPHARLARIHRPRRSSAHSTRPSRSTACSRTRPSA
jgi:hypothetical protein